VHHAHKVGLIDMLIGSKATGLRTLIRASPELADEFEKLQLIIYALPYPDKKVIILRNKDPKNKKHSIELPYKDSDFEPIVSMRQELNKYNRLLWRTFIDIPTLDRPVIEREVWNKKKQKKETQLVHISQNNKFVRRIFYRGSWELGGRFHGGFWQQIGSAWRKQIYINNSPTVEQDYSGLHINLLYGLKCRQPSKEDPYELDHILLEFSKEEQRAVIKDLILMALNADNLKSAINAFRAKQPTGSKAKRLKQKDLILLIDAFKDKHSLIKDYLFTGIGNALMNIDGRISAKVIKHFTNKNIPVLTIHDSYITPYDFTGELTKIMNDAISDELNGFNINIKQEAVGRDWLRACRNMVSLTEQHQHFPYTLLTHFKETKGYKRRMYYFNFCLEDYYKFLKEL